MAKVTGIVRIKVDGQLLASKEGAKATNILGVEREEAMAAWGVAGYFEKPVVPTIECVLLHTSGTALKALDFTNATVNYESDNGTILSLQGAWLANALDLSAGGGEVSVTIKGERFEEIT